MCECSPVDIMPKLKKNILNFGYGTNFNYEGRSSHSFDRFYVVAKFVLPAVQDLKFYQLNLIQMIVIWINRSKFLTQYIPNIRNF